jgi:TolB-like protein
MSNSDSPQPRPTVFLSYASDDRQAAQAIRNALPGLGLDVWYDESGLGGGEAWDQKIRRQIRECDFFMPVISHQTEARHEGYFRREWRLAVERTLDMADDHIFLLPVAIDDTVEIGARVPERFLTVQWIRAPGGRPTPAFEDLCRRLAAGQNVRSAQPGKRTFEPTSGRAIEPTAGRAIAAVDTSEEHRKRRGDAPAPDYPEFPHEEPGQKTKFVGQVALWTIRSAWISFNRIPRWLRVVIYVWVCIGLVSRGCAPEDRSQHVTDSDERKIRKIAEQFRDSAKQGDVATLAALIAKQFPEETAGSAAAENGLLAAPFAVPEGDVEARKLADTTFAQVYGRVAISHHGHVALTNDPLPSSTDPAAAVERGRKSHARYVLYGSVGGPPGAQNLDVRLVSVDDEKLLWSGSYAVAAADPARIASEVDARTKDLTQD